MRNEKDFAFWFQDLINLPQYVGGITLQLLFGEHLPRTRKEFFHEEDFVDISGQYDQIQSFSCEAQFLYGIYNDELMFSEADGEIINEKVVGMG